MNTHISSRCSVTGTPISNQQSGITIENPDQAGDVRFGILWGAASSGSCCADSLCLEMIYLIDNAVAKQWLNEEPDHR